MNTNKINKQTYGGFLKFVVPSVATMIFLSFYTTIDGFFVSRYVGANALAAINIVIPITCFVFGIAVMLASGAGALISIKLGEGKKEEADQLFSFVTIMAVILAMIITLVGMIFLKPILRFLGATDALMKPSLLYGGITILMTVPMMIKLNLEYFARVDASSKTALLMSSIGLLLNVIFDYLFVKVFSLGITGAGLGTFLAITVSAVIGIGHFLGKHSMLKFKRTRMMFRELLQSCLNGSSEMFTEWSTGIITYLFNIKILSFYGENGIAAMAIIMYLYYFFISVYFGITVGIGPVISYHFGAGKKDEIKRSVTYSFITILWSSVCICLATIVFGKFIISCFSSNGAVREIAEKGLNLFWITFLLIGSNVFLSGYFTAIGDGLKSAVISLCRSLLFVSAAVLLLPELLGTDGIWLSMPLSEFLTLVPAFSFYWYHKHTFERSECMQSGKQRRVKEVC